MGVETGNSLNVSASARPATPPTAHNKTIPTSSSRRYRFCMCSPSEGSLCGDRARSHFDIPTSTVSTTVSLTPTHIPRERRNGVRGLINRRWLGSTRRWGDFRPPQTV